MAQDIYGLTLADVNFLKALKRAHDGNRQNPPSARLGYDGFDDAPQAPEVYIALVPGGGIPANEGDPELLPGTGSELDYQQGDMPGYADCQIYRIIGGVLQSCDFTKRVYNLTASAIDQGWITVVRDKFGNWIAQTGGGTPCEDRNEVWMIFLSSGVEGGTFDLTFTINGVEDTITIAAESTAAEVKTAFATHSELSSSDINVDGGDLPTTSVRVEFTGSQAGKAIRLTSFSGENLNNIPGTGTGTPATESGLAVFVSRWQPGYTAV
jgi:hypothetical protein